MCSWNPGLHKQVVLQHLTSGPLGVAASSTIPHDQHFMNAMRETPQPPTPTVLSAGQCNRSSFRYSEAQHAETAQNHAQCILNVIKWRKTVTEAGSVRKTSTSLLWRNYNLRASERHVSNIRDCFNTCSCFWLLARGDTWLLAACRYLLWLNSASASATPPNSNEPSYAQNDRAELLTGI